MNGPEPDKDVEIRFTGLRQGEKLDEELMEDPAGCSQSEHSHIMILRRENEALADLDKHVLDLEIVLRAIDSSAANPSSAAQLPAPALPSGTFSGGCSYR